MDVNEYDHYWWWKKNHRKTKNKKKSSEIPAFGNWDKYSNNDQPLTQYFDSPRQAGLIRFHHSSPPPPPSCPEEEKDGAHPRALHFHRCNYEPPSKGDLQAKGRRRQSLKQPQKTTVGGYNKTAPPPGPSKHPNAAATAAAITVTNKSNRVVGGSGVTSRVPGKQNHNTTNSKLVNINIKAVDEDLYKIPPELLQSSKRKKRLGFLWRCLVPACMV